jgi:hypothetical protein
MAKVNDLPSEAARGGSDNESIPAEQRAPEGNRIPKTSGPRVGKAGEYLPAEYKTAKGNTRQDR